MATRDGPISFISTGINMAMGVTIPMPAPPRTRAGINQNLSTNPSNPMQRPKRIVPVKRKSFLLPSRSKEPPEDIEDEGEAIIKMETNAPALLPNPLSVRVTGRRVRADRRLKLIRPLKSDQNPYIFYD